MQRSNAFVQNQVAIEEMYMAGIPISKIAERYGMTKHSLSLSIYRRGFREVKELRDKDLIAEIAARHQP